MARKYAYLRVKMSAQAQAESAHRTRQILNKTLVERIMEDPIRAERINRLVEELDLENKDLS